MCEIAPRDLNLLGHAVNQMSVWALLSDRGPPFKDLRVCVGTSTPSWQAPHSFTWALGGMSAASGVFGGPAGRLLPSRESESECFCHGWATPELPDGSEQGNLNPKATDTLLYPRH